MAIRLLQSALPQPTLTEADAIAIVEYHLERNRVAKRSHEKTWRKKHRKIKFKVLL